MTSVSIEKELLEDLLDSKLAMIAEKINQILKKWKYNSVELFLTHSADGTLEEAELDAISLTNLIDKRNNLFELKKTLA